MRLIGSPPRSACRRLALAAGLSLVAACSGGGGGGSSNTRPTITAAAFVGAGAAPVAGDSLLLFLSEDVQLVSGALLTDADLVLSAGTLGSVTAAPTQSTTRTVAVVLGAGVNLPNGTTVAFGAANDVVQDLQGALAEGGTPRAITAGDGDVPTISTLTLNGIDGELNGTGPAGGTLQVPRRGFTIDVTASDTTSTISAAATVIAASVTVSTSGGGISPGLDLAAAIGAPAVNGQTLSFTVPSTVSFPDGAVTLTVFVSDITGMASAPKTFSFLVKNLNDPIRPFETNVNPNQRWFLDLTRDLESYSVPPGIGPKTVTVTTGANSVADLEDLFTIIGLYGGNAPINAAVLAAIENRLTAELGSLFPGVNIAFTFTAPGPFPSGQSTVPYNSLSFAQICIAGAEDPAGDTGVLGVAILDRNNATQENDCLTDFAGTQRLGVFVHTVVNAGFEESAVQDFRTTFDALRPDLPSGVPIGNAVDGMDAQRVAGTLTNDSRQTTIQNAINRLARMVAVVTAHECGHSMGLVIDGAMPTGLYGGDVVNFPGSTSGHIRNASLFPPGSQNVMSPAISFTTANSPSTGFNTLNLAYLRERALYNN